MIRVAGAILGSVTGYCVLKLLHNLTLDKRSPPQEVLNRVDEIARKMEIYPTPNVYLGTEDRALHFLFPWEKRCIILTEDANDLVIAHELTHIKQNHFRKTVLLINIALPIIFNIPVYAFPIGCLGLFAVLRANSISQEREADRIGMQFASSVAIAETIKEFHLDRIAYKRMRETATGLSWIAKNILMNSNGDHRIDNFHPTFTERISEFQKELERRNELRPLQMFLKNSEEADVVEFPISEDENRKIREFFSETTDPLGFISVYAIVIKPYCFEWECHCKKDKYILQWNKAEDSEERFMKMLQSFDFYKESK